MNIVGTELQNGAFVEASYDVPLEKPLDIDGSMAPHDESCEALLMRLTSEPFDGYAAVAALARRNFLSARSIYHPEAAISPASLKSAQKAGAAAHYVLAHHFSGG